MGSMIYGIAGITVDIDDRELAHLRIVITSKLRRGESFNFTVSHGITAGSGRTSYWMHGAIPLVFRFSGSKPPAINRAWVESLTDDASKPDGLHNLPEPRHTSSAV